jgi:glycosyltransferase involved in cell wall biosynthesis
VRSSRPPHVAIDVRMARHSGIGTYIRNIVPRVLAARPNWRFSLLGDPALTSTFANLEQPNVTAVFCNAPIYSVREQLELVRRVPRESSLIWAPHYNAPMLARAPLLVTIHDLAHIACPEFAPGMLKQTYARTMFRRVKRQAAAIICVSRFTADELQRYIPGGGAPVTVVHSGVDAEWFASAGAETTATGRPYFVFVGNVKPSKNLGTLLRAFQDVMNELPHDLVIVGKRNGMLSADHAVLRLAERWPDRVRLTGEVSGAQLRRYVRGAVALVFPSLYEGFGLPPVEAMAAGCPCIVSTAAAIPETCGEAALYFDPNDASELASKLREIAGNDTLRAMLIRRGAEQARRYDWDCTTRQTIEVMESVF